MLQGWESQTRKLITGKGTWKQAVRPSGRCRRRHRGSPLATRGTADLPDLPFVWVLSGLDTADGCGQHRARRHLCSHRHLKTHVRHGPVQKAREETAGRPGALRGPRPGSTRGLAERRGASTWSDSREGDRLPEETTTSCSQTLPNLGVRSRERSFFGCNLPERPKGQTNTEPAVGAGRARPGQLPRRARAPWGSCGQQLVRDSADMRAV